MLDKWIRTKSEWRTLIEIDNGFVQDTDIIVEEKTVNYFMGKWLCFTEHSLLNT